MENTKSKSLKPAKFETYGKRDSQSHAEAAGDNWNLHEQVRLATPAGDAGCYPPVESVLRALEILREVNRQPIATVRGLHLATGYNKSTIVRMLQTLIDAGYVVADKLCAGYRTTRKVRELVSGYNATSCLIEAARPLAIELTERLNWPVSIGVVDGAAVTLLLHTGLISPWSYSTTLLRTRPNLTTSAMGRAYLAFCPASERTWLIERLRKKLEITDSNNDEFQEQLREVRSMGFALRDPDLEPRRMTTLAMPIRQNGEVIALIAGSFYKTVADDENIVEYAVKPLAAAIERIEKRMKLDASEERDLDIYEQGSRVPVRFCH